MSSFADIESFSFLKKTKTCVKYSVMIMMLKMINVLGALLFCEVNERRIGKKSAYFKFQGQRKCKFHDFVAFKCVLGYMSTITLHDKCYQKFEITERQILI